MRTLLFSLALAFTIAGCGDSGSGGQPDLRSLVDAAVANDLVSPGAMTSRYVASSITLPQSRNDFAFDLNGDGKPDNHLGEIVAALKGQNIDLQAQEVASIQMGNGLEVFGFTTSDATLTSDPGAGAWATVAKPQPNPDFGGKGQFTVDKSVPRGDTSGPLAAGVYTSADPKALTVPPTIWLNIPLYTDTSVNLPLVGARLTFTPAKSSLMTGQINGGVRQQDVDQILIPALASTLDRIGKKMPCDANCMQVLKTFDTNKDGTITVDEVRMNFLIQALLGPDVQLFDDLGKWKPNPQNTTKDSLSFGVQFNAVSATVIE